MPGNDRPHGALRRPGTKKGPTIGSGGQKKKGLQGKGPTPKAEDRPYHPAAKARKRAEARAAQPTRVRQLEKIRRRFEVPEGYEIITGRNAVAEAARAGVPISRVFMAVSAESDDRLGAVRLDLEALRHGEASGPLSIAEVVLRLDKVKTLVWNGPFGAFELAPFDTATVAVAKAAAKRVQAGELVAVAGGGDTVSAMNHAGIADELSYISTAGGAFLEWMEGKALPGVEALRKA